jgi:hypothetical protein
MNEWHVVENGNTIGPISQQELLDGLTSGRFHQDTLVWRQGLTTHRTRPCLAAIPALLKACRTHSRGRSPEQVRGLRRQG